VGNPVYASLCVCTGCTLPYASLCVSVFGRIEASLMRKEVSFLLRKPGTTRRVLSTHHGILSHHPGMYTSLPPGYTQAAHGPPVACRTVSGEQVYHANPSSCRTSSYCRGDLPSRVLTIPVSLLVDDEGVVHDAQSPPGFLWERRECGTDCSSSHLPVSLLGIPFVADGNYSLVQKEGIRRAYVWVTVMPAITRFTGRR